jgi:hypothetical protein
MDGWEIRGIDLVNYGPTSMDQNSSYKFMLSINNL